MHEGGGHFAVKIFQRVTPDPADPPIVFVSRPTVVHATMLRSVRLSVCVSVRPSDAH